MLELSILGFLTEGPQYYTHALPRPQLNSRQVLDADRCVRALFEASQPPATKAAAARTRTAKPERATLAQPS